MSVSPDPITPSPESPLEQFLKAAEEKTSNTAHQRLLKAVRGVSPSEAIESEFQTIIQEIIDDN